MPETNEANIRENVIDSNRIGFDTNADILSRNLQMIILLSCNHNRNKIYCFNKTINNENRR